MTELKKEFALSFADLCMLASNLVILMNRDSVQFLTRGVTAQDISDFEAMGNDFEIFPPDEYYSALVSAEVEAKETARTNCTNNIRLISGFFEQMWGIADYRYKQLNIKSFHNRADSNFLTTARNVVAVATEYLADLSPIGLTQGMIDALETEAQTFEDKMNNINTQKALRDSKTQERTLNGNDLYNYCKKYSTIGKLIWENLDEAKYNDYVIYKTEEKGLGKVRDLAYDIPTTTASWDSLQFAVDYQLQYKPAQIGAEWEVVYEGVDTSTVFAPGVDAFTLRCRGHNSEGYGDWSDELNVIIPV